MKNPKVSVLTSIYNTDHAHLRACIESVLNQTFTDFEFIILNDSPDNTGLDDVVGQYRDERIKYIKNDKNMGISAARNRLLDLARGQYLAIFDHDDICMPHRLAAQVKFLDKNPAVGVVSGLMEYFDDAVTQCTPGAPEYDTDIKIMLTRDCCVAHSAAMIRRSVLLDNNIRYEEYYSPSEDYRLWARLMSVTRFHNIQDVLVRYRNHNFRTSVSRHNEMNRAWHSISMEMRNQFPEYYHAMLKSDNAGITVFRARLFGRIPLVKIKNNRVYLFEFIPLMKLCWK